MKTFLRVDRSKPRAFASSPSDATLIRVVRPVQRSCTKASRALFVSPGTRFPARERKPTNLPSPLITPRTWPHGPGHRSRRRSPVPSGACGGRTRTRRPSRSSPRRRGSWRTSGTRRQVRGHRSTMPRCDSGLPERADAHASRSSGDPVGDEDIHRAVLVRRNEVRGSDENAIVHPSALTSAARLAASASPSFPVLTRFVSPAARSRTNTSATPLRSSGTRLLAEDGNATTRPSALIDGFLLAPSPSAPEDEMLARQVRPFTRSRTKTSVTPFRSPRTSDVAPDTKATKRPLALSAAPNVAPFAWAPFVLRFARSTRRTMSSAATCAPIGCAVLERGPAGCGNTKCVDDPRGPPHSQALHRRPSSHLSSH